MQDLPRETHSCPLLGWEEGLSQALRTLSSRSTRWLVASSNVSNEEKQAELVLYLLW
jgi:hypothetical protein